MKLFFSVIIVVFGVFITVWHIFLDPYFQEIQSKNKKTNKIKVLILFVFGVVFVLILIFLLAFFRNLLIYQIIYDEKIKNVWTLLLFLKHAIIKVRNVKISSMDSTKTTSTANRGGLFLHSLRLRACGLGTTCLLVVFLV